MTGPLLTAEQVAELIAVPNTATTICGTRRRRSSWGRVDGPRRRRAARARRRALVLRLYGHALPTEVSTAAERLERARRDRDEAVIDARLAELGVDLEGGARRRDRRAQREGERSHAILRRGPECWGRRVSAYIR